MTLKASFGAVTDARTQVLILGSLPGERSLAAREYYAHPQNRFWDLVGAVIDRELRPLSYDDRLAALAVAGIGLWDTVATARRRGSLDSAIENARVNDLASLALRAPKLEAIAHNGGESARAMRLTRSLGLPVHRLPSTSPANASWRFERKLAAWRAVFEEHGVA